MPPLWLLSAAYPSLLQARLSASGPSGSVAVSTAARLAQNKRTERRLREQQQRQREKEQQEQQHAAAALAELQVQGPEQGQGAGSMEAERPAQEARIEEAQRQQQQQEEQQEEQERQQGAQAGGDGGAEAGGSKAGVQQAERKAQRKKRGQDALPAAGALRAPKVGVELRQGRAAAGCLHGPGPPSCTLATQAPHAAY